MASLKCGNNLLPQATVDATGYGWNALEALSNAKREALVKAVANTWALPDECPQNCPTKNAGVAPVTDNSYRIDAQGSFSIPISGPPIGHLSFTVYYATVTLTYTPTIYCYLIE